MTSIPEIYTFENLDFPYAGFIIRKYGTRFEKIEDVGDMHIKVKCISPGKGYGREHILLANKLLRKIQQGEMSYE